MEKNKSLLNSGEEQEWIHKNGCKNKGGVTMRLLKKYKHTRGLAVEKGGKGDIIQEKAA